MSVEALIKLLADGRWHSGEDLAATLGVSRAAIWKQLKALTSVDLALEANRGQGYRLTTPFTPLAVEQVAAAVGESKCNVAAIACDWQQTSTNDAVLELAGATTVNKPFAVAFAEHQTAGRGRRGRQWEAPLGGSILMSLLWRLESMPSNPAAAALVAGLAVAEAVEECAPQAKVELKWPNDVYVNGRKLAGVLCEMRGDPTSECQLVVGVGINFGLAGVASDIDQAVIDCEGLGIAHSERPKLAGWLVGRLVERLQCFETQGFLAVRDEWEKRDWLAGKPVRVMLRAQSRDGVAVSVADDGALIVDHDGVYQRHVAGEVSVRRK